MGSMSRQLGWEDGTVLFISDVGKINHLLELIVPCVSTSRSTRNIERGASRCICVY